MKRHRFTVEVDSEYTGHVDMAREVSLRLNGGTFKFTVIHNGTVDIWEAPKIGERWRRKDGFGVAILAIIEDGAYVVMRLTDGLGHCFPFVEGAHYVKLNYTRC